MRASTAVAILSLIAGVALAVALPLPAIKSERASGRPRLGVPAPGRPPEGYTWDVRRPRLPGPRLGQPQTIIPPSRHAHPRPTFTPPPGFRPIVPIRRPGRPQLDPAEHPPAGSPPLQPMTFMLAEPEHYPDLLLPGSPPHHSPTPSPPQNTPPLSPSSPTHSSDQTTDDESTIPHPHLHQDEPGIVQPHSAMEPPWSVMRPPTPPNLVGNDRLIWEQQLLDWQHRYHDLSE